MSPLEHEPICPCLSRDEVRAALRFEGPPRPPLAMSLWLNAETRTHLGSKVDEFQRRFPDDVLHAGMTADYWRAPADDPTYRWAFGGKTKPEGVAVDACPVIANWSELDAFLDELPDPRRPVLVDGIIRHRAAHPDRYILVGWGHYLHQRLAYLRGMENLLFDFVDHREELGIVMDALLDLYRVWARRAAEAGADGVWAGDDLGTQRSLFMSPEMFRALYKPYYLQLAQCLHENGLDFWLHTCGNVTRILDDLIECGVDALHPIQVGTMDDEAVAGEYGGRIAFWIGMDVQQVLPFGSVAEVREHCAQRMRTFFRPDGGLILGAGNAIMPETPVENITAYLETVREPVIRE